MPLGYGDIAEIYLHSLKAARVRCDRSLIPAPGRYLLADAAGSHMPLAVALFCSDTQSDGFVAAPPIPAAWIPGTLLRLRGPLGHGFNLPNSARQIALVAFEAHGRPSHDSTARLAILLKPAIEQNASIVLVCDQPPEDLPLQIEVQPKSVLMDVLGWADFVAMDIVREDLPELRKRLDQASRNHWNKDAQVLIHSPMPCGGLAECGVCAVEYRGGQKLACKEGPVFDLKEFLD